MDFLLRFGDLSDAEVLEIVRDGRESYIPEAWEAICAEARRRHINVDEVAAPEASED